MAERHCLLGGDGGEKRRIGVGSERVGWRNETVREKRLGNAMFARGLGRGTSQERLLAN